MKNIKSTRVGSEAQYDPRTVGEILHDYLENSNEPLALAYRKHASEAEEQGWYRNTELCMDVKTILRSDRIMKTNQSYVGMLRKDTPEHLTFVETLPWMAKRNPHVFAGKYISITRKDDGTLRLNFRPMPQLSANLSIENYAFEVYRELRRALKGLVEKGDCE